MKVKSATSLAIQTCIILIMAITSCRRKGCTDSTATNYDPKAKKDDASCLYPKATHRLTLEFKHRFNEVDITPNWNQLIFQNAAGEQLGVNTLKYVLSNIKIHLKTGDSVLKSDMHFINLEDSSTLFLNLNDIEKNLIITAISFDFGLAPVRNISGKYSLLNSENFNWPDQLGGGYHFLTMEGMFIDQASDTLSYLYHMGKARKIENSDTTFYNNHFYNRLVIGEKNIDNDFNAEIIMNLDEWYKNPHIWELNQESISLMPDYQAQIKMNANGRSVFEIKILD